ncbi:MAG: caspase family protein [Hydrococcus sp. Prado102]|jgi:hypothetical protein|nr:caspase family protein [Hydrococcus sp. Prado102]
MAKGISINIGLNYIDKTIYGSDGALKGCVNDAKAMKAIAESQGFKSQLILNEEATYNNICNAITKASHELISGDVFLLTIACHGSQIPSLNGSDDEVDGLDETWVLFDRQLIDDELYELLQHFRAGVRILVISDSCHSGTMLRPLSDLLNSQGAQKIIKTFEADFVTEKPRVFRSFEQSQEETIQQFNREIRLRSIPPEISQNEFRQRESTYRTVQQSLATFDLRESIRASVLLLSGCQDNQLSSDGDKNGFFTETLLKVWNSGNFKGDYISLYKEIRGNMPPWQTPNYYKVGNDDSEFEKQKPFSIFNSISIKGDDMTVNTNTIPVNEVSEATNDPRFLESIAVAVATVAVEAAIKELTRGGVVGNRTISSELTSDTRFWETIAVAVGTEVTKAVIKELTRGGMMGNGTNLSLPNHESRAWWTPPKEVSVGINAPFVSAGISIRELVLKQLAKEGVVRSTPTSSVPLDRSWDSLLEKVAEKVLEKVINKL